MEGSLAAETPEAWKSSPCFLTMQFVSLHNIDELRQIQTRYNVQRNPIDQAKHEAAGRKEGKLAPTRPMAKVENLIPPKLGRTGKRECRS